MPRPGRRKRLRLVDSAQDLQDEKAMLEALQGGAWMLPRVASSRAKIPARRGQRALIRLEKKRSVRVANYRHQLMYQIVHPLS